jgi:hypothetical protein
MFPAILIVTLLAPANPAALHEHPTLVKLHQQHSQHRVRNGLQPQKLDPTLCKHAQAYCGVMARANSMTHSAMAYNENIAYGYGSADAAMNGWIYSPGHNANLLSGHTMVGFGYQLSADGTPYWISIHANSAQADPNMSMGGGGGSYRRGFFRRRR